VKKTVNLGEGEASLIVPDELSLESCEKLERWLTELLRVKRAFAMARQRNEKLRTSLVAHVANDDEVAK
jgi:hypothetical protein